MLRTPAAGARREEVERAAVLSLAAHWAPGAGGGKEKASCFPSPGHGARSRTCHGRCVTAEVLSRRGWMVPHELGLEGETEPKCPAHCSPESPW